jgi:D-serine deaminase-like pyridoxal phosphate-dependent protein
MQSSRPPAEIGMPLHEVDTPALLVDLDAFERNLQRLAQHAARAGVALRPHAKTHKSPAIALRQIASGAVGVCCQKVSEAAAMVDGGVGDVLISNEIVGRQKIARLAVLAHRARIAVCVDDPENVAALSEAAQAEKVTLDVLVEINVGANRCGVSPGEPALELARRVAGAAGLHFRGLQAYHGSAQHLRSGEQRRAAIDGAILQSRETRDLLHHHGIQCRVICGAGTGTYPLEAASGVYNELQAGSYLFMDGSYARNRSDDGSPFAEFQHSLFVYTTVMSRATEQRAVVDAGMKALSVDSGMPTVWGIEAAEYVGASDEHGTLQLATAAQSIRLGDKLRLVPGHCDPTVNLHDWYVGIRGDRVETLWPITARGPGF